MRKFGNLLWGIVLIALGVVIGLNAMGITNINFFFPGWWTLFIIVPSFIGFFRNPNRLWSFIWFAIGVVLLLCAQGWLSFALIGKLLLPAVLIVFGVVLIFRDTIHSKVNAKIKQLNKGELEEYCATFGEQKVKIEGDEFKGAKLDAVFGSVDLDLRTANIREDQIIEASAIFGGIEIMLPQDVNIKVKSTPIFGGVTNKAITIKGENVPTLYVNSFCMFGGVTIK